MEYVTIVQSIYCFILVRKKVDPTVDHYATQIQLPVRRKWKCIYTNML